MPDANPPDQKRGRKPQKMIQDSLPETGVPPAEAGKSQPRKRSFYARYVTQVELSDLEQFEPEKLTDEIALLRVSIRRCFQAACAIESTDIEGWVKALATLGSATTRLANLLRIQKVLSLSGDDEIRAAISKGLMRVMEEFNL